MTKESEYKRGLKSAKNYFSKFRSYKKDNQGRWVGYKKAGSTEVIGTEYQFGIGDKRTKPFGKGWNDYMLKEFKNKKVKSKSKKTPARKMESFLGGW